LNSALRKDFRIHKEFISIPLFASKFKFLKAVKLILAKVLSSMKYDKEVILTQIMDSVLIIRIWIMMLINSLIVKNKSTPDENE
jgi:hypothetical protein